MFFGTTPQIISQYIYSELQVLRPKRVFVPFAGNFVMEQVAYNACPESEIFSTDVMIYSNAIGYGLTGQNFKLEVKKEYQEDFNFLSKKNEPIEKAAITIFFTEISRTLNKRHIPYYQTQYEDAVTNQEQYFSEIMNKLTKVRDSLRFKFYGKDALLLLSEVKKGDVVLYDPPVSENNKDYISEYKYLNDILKFDEVEYTMFDNELKIKTLLELHKKGAIIYWRTNNPIIAPKGFTEVYNYRYKWNAHYCIYSNKAVNKFVGSWSPLSELVKNIPIINETDIITRKSKIEIIPQPMAVGNHYRIMWIKKAQMLDSGRCFVILINGKLIGIAQMLDALKYGTDLAVINSDPAAPTSQYKKLSKLMLHIICTKEMLNELNDYYMWEHIGFTTRVFSNAPVSMKYRGMFKLVKRVEDKESDFKYKLIYQNRERIFKTYREGLINWVDKYGNQTKEKKEGINT